MRLVPRACARPLFAGSVTVALLLALAAPGPGSAARFVKGPDQLHPRVKFGDSLVSINDRCAVKENELSTEIRPIYVNAKPVAFCCTTCPAIFVQGPEPYLVRMKASFTDPVHPGRPARIQAALRYHVNWEVFYFADRASMDEFRKRPADFCGLLTDPVNGVRFHPGPKSPKEIHAGRPFFFTSDSTRTRFQAAPIEFAYRKGA